MRVVELRYRFSWHMEILKKQEVKSQIAEIPKPLLFDQMIATFLWNPSIFRLVTSIYFFGGKRSDSKTEPAKIVPTIARDGLDWDYVKPACQHLDSYKNQNDSDSRTQIDKTANYSGKKKIHGTKSQGLHKCSKCRR